MYLSSFLVDRVCVCCSVFKMKTPDKSASLEQHLLVVGVAIVVQIGS